MKIERYPAYKDSGIEWLGEVPVHWEVRRLKELIVGSLTYGANESSNDSNPNHPRFIRITDFSDNEELRSETFKSLPPDIANKFLLKEGDILFARSGATVGKTFHFKNYFGLACYAGYLIKARPKQSVMTSDFLSYYTKSHVYNNWKNGITIKATIENISAEKYGFFLFVPIPPLQEQKAIAGYLDKKTGQIDKKIELLTQKAKLYGELKQSLINETVTRGLDKSVPVKDSGIEWLGEVPVYWRIYHLKNTVSLKITDGPHETPIFTDNGVPFISAEAIQNGGINFESKRGYISEETDKIYARKCKPKRNDIFIVKSGSTTGKIGYVSTDINFNIWSPLALVRANKINYSRYLFYFLSSSFFQKQVQMYWSFGTQPNIGMKVLENLQVTVPPLNEQKAIAGYLDTKTGQIDRIIETINTQIEKLKELRKTLINDVVTGKIKVI